MAGPGKSNNSSKWLLLAAGWVVYLSSFVVPGDFNKSHQAFGAGFVCFVATPVLASTLLMATKYWELLWLLTAYWANYSVMPWSNPRPAMRILAILSPWIMAAVISPVELPVRIWEFLPFYFWATGIFLIQVLGLIHISLGPTGEDQRDKKAPVDAQSSPESASKLTT